MKKIILFIVIILITSSCAKKNFVIMIEQPSDNMMDKLKVELVIDKVEIKKFDLKTTIITPSYITTEFTVSKFGVHYLEVRLKDTTFNYQINYPKEKYIIVSPYFKKNGKINIGILKQKEKFQFQ